MADVVRVEDGWVLSEVELRFAKRSGGGAWMTEHFHAPAGYKLAFSINFVPEG